MTKTQALKLLGGTETTAAVMVGVTYQAIAKWPEMLTSRIEDRVVSALVRHGQPVPAELLAPREAEAA